MRFLNIQIARAIAANFVILAHLGVIETKYSGGFSLISNLAPWGAAGVDLFFVVSGFIMATIARKQTPRRFILSRVTRIFPPYWLYSALVLGVSLSAPALVNSSLAVKPILWKSFLLLPDEAFPLLAVGWTLIHEMYFYIVIAGLLSLGAFRASTLILWAAIVAVGNLTIQPTQPTLSLILNPLTLEFIGGAVVGFIVAIGRTTFAASAKWLGLFLLAFVVVTLDVDPTISNYWLRVAVFGVPFCLIIYSLTASTAAQGQGGLAVIIGDASYSIYLSHVLVLSVLGRAFKAMPIHNYAIEALFLLACIVCANVFGLLSFSLIEKPCLAFLRRKTAGI